MDPEPKSQGVYGTAQRKLGLRVTRAPAAKVLPLGGLRPCFGHEVPNRQYQLSRGGCTLSSPPLSPQRPDLPAGRTRWMEMPDDMT